jgi:hypothetical protein
MKIQQNLYENTYNSQHVWSGYFVSAKSFKNEKSILHVTESFGNRTNKCLPSCVDVCLGFKYEQKGYVGWSVSIDGRTMREDGIPYHITIDVPENGNAKKMGKLILEHMNYAPQSNGRTLSGLTCINLDSDKLKKFESNDNSCFTFDLDSTLTTQETYKFTNAGELTKLGKGVKKFIEEYGTVGTFCKKVKIRTNRVRRSDKQLKKENSEKILKENMMDVFGFNFILYLFEEPISKDKISISMTLDTPRKFDKRSMELQKYESLMEEEITIFTDDVVDLVTHHPTIHSQQIIENGSLIRSFQRLDGDYVYPSTYRKEIVDIIKKHPNFIYIVSGPAGCGKTSFLKPLADELGIDYIERDMFEKSKSLTKALSKAKTCIFAQTNYWLPKLNLPHIVISLTTPEGTDGIVYSTCVNNMKSREHYVKIDENNNVVGWGPAHLFAKTSLSKEPDYSFPLALTHINEQITGPLHIHKVIGDMQLPLNRKDFKNNLSRIGIFLKWSNDKSSVLLKYRMGLTDFKKPESLECRGLILEWRTFKVLCYPFDKFFNFGDTFCKPIDFKKAFITEKLDGSFVKLFYYKEWKWATNGCPEASQACAGVSNKLTYQNLIDDTFGSYENLDKSLSYFFEFIHPEINTVVNNKTRQELVLLGARNMITMKEIPINDIDLSTFSSPSINIPEIHSFDTFDECKSHANSFLGDEKEGYVVSNIDEEGNITRAKLKSSNYVRLHLLGTNPDRRGNPYKMAVYVWLLGELEESLSYNIISLENVEKWRTVLNDFYLTTMKKLEQIPLDADRKTIVCALKEIKPSGNAGGLFFGIGMEVLIRKSICTYEQFEVYLIKQYTRTNKKGVLISTTRTEEIMELFTTLSI